MAEIAIYTANFGGYDRTREQRQQDVDVEWIYITDGEGVPDVPHEWDVRNASRGVLHPNMAAKVYKAQPPWELFADDTRYAIWLDANMQITDDTFARAALSYVHDGMATWAHPRRDCVYDEARVCLPGGKEAQNDRYRNLPIAEQMRSYVAEGYPEHAGLYASGNIVWTREGSETIGKAWLDECERWGFQDQLALPVVCWRLDKEPGVFGVDQIERAFSSRVSRRQRELGRPFYLGNRWLRIHPHAREPYV